MNACFSRKSPAISFLCRGFFSLFLIVVASALSALVASTEGFAQDSFILKTEEIPAGMQFGRIPPQMKRLIKENPWVVDRGSIPALSKAIYENPAHWTIRKMVMVILATRINPYQDDIVYYGFVYRDKQTAEREYQKLARVQQLNASRSLLLRGEKSVILLFSDREDLFPQLMALRNTLQAKLAE